MTAILDEFALSPSVDGHLKTFEEKQQKSYGILSNFLMYVKDSEHFPLLLTLVNRKDPNLEPYCRMFFVLTSKLNIVARAYKMPNFPIGCGTQMKDLYQAIGYWLNCCIIKAEYILPLLKDDKYNQFLLHDKVARVVLKVNARIEKLFRLTLWNPDWPKLLPLTGNV